ncbi:MAG: hypothetical protein A3G81_19645 [Betaproteobacteria bacterium RIFCSPLOWO2_12_FULL_65_14]|nr:MAG: hypothetical protein A3G81_19645 [Betaproteobacteria bacterium RIFCSPLOWO2_12_FULL_65_14]
MRRGLIAWSKEQVPPSALDARVRRVQQALGAQGLDALLAYTNFTRPAAVSWLTHFIPYWSEALVVVLPEGAPLLLASLSKRMFPWAREVSHVGEIVPAPDLGRAAAAFVEQRALEHVGVVDLEHLPWSVAEPMGIGAELVDASELFAALRQPADRYENALAARATQIAERALAAIPGQPPHAAEILAAVEVTARLEGAEEIIPRISEIGDRTAVELSVAYKGVWIRLCRTYPLVADAESWFKAVLQDHAVPPPGKLTRRTVESCIGSSPLSVVEDQDRVYRRLPAGAQAVLSVRLNLEDGPWRAAAPFLVRA